MKYIQGCDMQYNFNNLTTVQSTVDVELTDFRRASLILLRMRTFLIAGSDRAWLAVNLFLGSGWSRPSNKL